MKIIPDKEGKNRPLWVKLVIWGALLLLAAATIYIWVLVLKAEELRINNIFT